MSDSLPAGVLNLTSQIVSAHVSHNSVTPDTLSLLIQAVYRSLAMVGRVDAVPVPAVPIRKSVSPDFIICLEDGKRMKMLKRHLQNSYGMTPAEYRVKWGLPFDYPMTAPNYARRRSVIAKDTDLARKPTAASVVSVFPARRAEGSKG